MPEGKTVTIQHLSSEQAQQTATDTQLPDTSGGGGIGGWISQHRIMLLIVGGGAILGIIIYFYIKNQNAQTQASSTTDTGSPTDGTTTAPGQPGSVDLSPLENLMNQLQQQQDLTNQDLAQILAQEQGEPGTTSGGGCPHDMHKCGKMGPPNNGCCCNKKNMVNKGTHCEPKKGAKGGAEDHAFALGGSDMFNDMFQVREPFRNTGHRMNYYALGGSEVTYHGKPGTSLNAQQAGKLGIFPHFPTTKPTTHPITGPIKTINLDPWNTGIQWKRYHHW